MATSKSITRHVVACPRRLASTSVAQLAACRGRWQALLLISLLAGVSPLVSAGSDATNLTLTAAVVLAIQSNPELASLRAKWEAMQERPAQAGALPNPMFKYGGMDATEGGRWPNTGEKRFMVEQTFPWFGKRELRAQVAHADVTIMQQDLETMTRDVRMMVKEAYFDLQAVRQAATITRKDEEMLRRMAKLAEAMYTTGQRTEQDVLKAKAESTMLQQRLLELAAQENTLQARLNTLLSRPADAPVGPLTEIPPLPAAAQLQQLQAQAAANRPEVRLATARASRYDLERQLMQKERLPDYQLGLEYRHIGRDADMVMVTIGVELPIWRDKSAAGVREAELMQAASEASLTAARQRSAFDVQDAAFKLNTARRTVELYRQELVPQAEARFRTSEAGYQAGQVDFMDLLESQRFLLNARVMAVMAAGTLGMQAARLERATGVPLDTDLATHPAAAELPPAASP